MKVKVNGTWQEVEFEGPVAALLKHLNVNREIVVVKVNEDIVAETETVTNTDTVEIVKVVFGG